MSKKRKQKNTETFPEVRRDDDEEIWSPDADYYCIEHWDDERNTYRYRLERADEKPLIPHGPKKLTFDSRYIVEKAFSQLRKSVERLNPKMRLIDIEEFEDF